MFFQFRYGWAWASTSRTWEADCHVYSLYIAAEWKTWSIEKQYSRDSLFLTSDLFRREIYSQRKAIRILYTFQLLHTPFVVTRDDITEITSDSSVWPWRLCSLGSLLTRKLDVMCSPGCTFAVVIRLLVHWTDFLPLHSGHAQNSQRYGQSDYNCWTTIPAGHRGARNKTFRLSNTAYAANTPNNVILVQDTPALAVNLTGETVGYQGCKRTEDFFVGPITQSRSKVYFCRQLSDVIKMRFIHEMRRKVLLTPCRDKMAFEFVVQSWLAMKFSHFN